MHRQSPVRGKTSAETWHSYLWSLRPAASPFPRRNQEPLRPVQRGKVPPRPCPSLRPLSEVRTAPWKRTMHRTLPDKTACSPGSTRTAAQTPCPLHHSTDTERSVHPVHTAAVLRRMRIHAPSHHTGFLPGKRHLPSDAQPPVRKGSCRPPGSARSVQADILPTLFLPYPFRTRRIP